MFPDIYNKFGCFLSVTSCGAWKANFADENPLSVEDASPAVQPRDGQRMNWISPDTMSHPSFLRNKHSKTEKWLMWCYKPLVQDRAVQQEQGARWSSRNLEGPKAVSFCSTNQCMCTLKQSLIWCSINKKQWYAGGRQILHTHLDGRITPLMLSKIGSLTLPPR
jgi:hypothetical protein